jgi:hypothetical protein
MKETKVDNHYELEGSIEVASEVTSVSFFFMEEASMP